jgi:SAM-dependent MidA family methyltransferase
MSHTGAELPPPDEIAQQHSDQLQAVIRAEIETCGGAISFARFMEIALYQPGLGYYSAGARKFGEAGDFVTAPELSPLFSRCLARQCRQVLAEIGFGDILEFGAGTGVMAAELLLELERLDALPGQYFILELSPDLKQRQRDTLNERASHLLERVCWLDVLPASGFQGVILANEVVDAMPVHLVRFLEEGMAERCVGWDGHSFVWQERPPQSAELQEYIDSLVAELGAEVFCPGYVTEINLAQQGWINSLAALLERGAALIIDYGFPRHEYYHPDRTTGTLMCHYRHRAHGDPLILAGLQDITAHVDFTALADSAQQAGLEVLGYTSQAQFLLATGLTEMLAEADPSHTRRYLQLTQQVKKLTLPSEMGELFKILALGREIPYNLTGFSLQDRRHKL